MILQLVTVIVLLTAFSNVKAHGFIVRAVPEDGAVLNRAPTRLQYWFSEGLEAGFSSVNVRDASGEVIASGGVDPNNSALLRVQLPPNLPDGAYVVELRPAFASDGHVNSETQVFFVGQAVSGVTGKSQSQNAIPLEVFWRALTYSVTMLLFGVFTLYSGVLVPAWGNKAYPAGLLPPRVMERLNWIVGISLAVTLIGSIIALLQQSMAFFNVGLVEVVTQNLWSLVRSGTRFGDVWNFRMAMLALTGGLFAAGLYYRNEQPKSVRAFWTASAWVMALVVGTFSVVSHAAGSLMLPWLGIAVDWLHTVGVGFWVGGLAALVLVLPIALKPYSGDAKRQALLAALRRYSRFALGSALLVITTGIYSALSWVYTPAELTETNFGLSLLLKVALVVGLLGVGAVHHIALHPERFAWLRRGTSTPVRFLLTLRLETVFALLVLCAAGLLTATPIPVPDYAENQIPAPRGSQTVGNYVVTQTITPGGPGANTYDVSVTTQDGTPVDGLSVQLQQIYPALDIRGRTESADAIEGGSYVSADGTIDRAGEWWTLLDLRDADGNLTRAAFSWDIREDAAVIQSQPLRLQHVLALLAILAVLGWVSYPTFARWTRMLDLNPTNVLLAFGATAATVVLLGFGYVLLQQTSQQYQESTTPPPAVVNRVLPDEISLEQGERLFQTHCAAWETLPDQLTLLKGRLVDARDSEIYAMTQNGWRGLPPCEGDMSEPERWSLVNYLRTLSH